MKLSLARCWFLLIIFTPALQAAEKDSDIQLRFAIDGIIAEVKANAGQNVKAGTVLARLQQDVFRAQLEFAKTQLEAEQTAFDEAEKEWQRAEELYERTVLSDHELMTAKVDFQHAAAKLSAAKAALAEADYNMQQSELIAPSSGKISRVTMQVGEYVNTRWEQAPMIVMGK